MNSVIIKKIKPSRNQRKKENSMIECFVDRDNQLNIFKQHLNAISPEGSLLLFYLGTGGVGKTALIKELENTLLSKVSKFKYVEYTFNSGTDMLLTLNALRGTLKKKYKVEFPLYEKGCIYHYQKLGDIALSNVRIEETLNESLIIENAKKYLGSTLGKLGDAQTLTKATEILTGIGIDVLKELNNTSTVLRAANVIFDKWIEYRAEKALHDGDEIYSELISELEERKDASQMDAVKEFLPELFARDLSDWLEENHTNLVIFLDTYEILTGDEKNIKLQAKLVYDNRDVPVDWWIENLILSTSRVLWVIAGRSEIEKIGESLVIAESGNICQLTAFDDKISNEFLMKFGIDDAQLRKGIINLTGGYPIYLNLCVNTYQETIKKRTPTIEDFGKKREDIVKRLLNAMDEGSQYMIYRLCILGTWTDTIARGVLRSLKEYNDITYNRLKKLCFISSHKSNFDDNKIFLFDKSIQKILIGYLKENESMAYLLTETRDAVNEFFCSSRDEFFPNTFKFVGNIDINNQYFKIWYEIILRTTDDANELLAQFRKNLFQVLVSYVDYEIPPKDNEFNELNIRLMLFDIPSEESALIEFKNKIETIAGTENDPYIYFEIWIADTKKANGRLKESLQYAESAYEKMKRFDVNSELKIFVNLVLIDIYKELERYADAINLNSEIVAEAEKFYQDPKDAHVITAKKERINLLESCNKYDEALKIYEEIYNVLKDLNNERSAKVAGDYADALGRSNHSDSLAILEKIIELYRQANDTSGIISAKNDLADYWQRQRDFEKELSLREELLAFCKENNYYWDISYIFYKVIRVIELLADFERYGDAHKCWEDFFAELKSNFNSYGDIRYIESMNRNIYHFINEVQYFYDNESYYDENNEQNYPIRGGAKCKDFYLELSANMKKDVDAFTDSIKNLSEQTYEENFEHLMSDPNADIENTIWAMECFIDNVEPDEQFALYEKCLARVKEKFSSVDEIKMIFFTTPLYFKVLSKDVGNCDLVLEKFSEIIDKLEESNIDILKNYWNTIRIINSLHLNFNGLNANKLSEVQERTLNLLKKHFVEDAPEIIDVMESWASAYNNIKAYEKALDLYNEIISMQTKKYGDESNWEIKNNIIKRDDILEKLGRK